MARPVQLSSHLIQIGDEIKPVSKSRYMVVEAIARRQANVPCLVFLLDDGTTYEANVGAYIWCKEAATAA